MVAGSYVLLCKRLPNCLPKWSYVSHSHQQRGRVPVAQHPVSIWFFAELRGLWDLSPKTRDRTQPRQWKRQVLTPELPGNSPYFVLMCVFIVICDILHLFICLFAICISLRWVFFFPDLLPIFILYCFLIVEFWEFFAYFGYNPLSDMDFANISPSLWFVFSLTVSFAEQKFLISISPIHQFFFHGSCFWCCI